MGLLDIFRIGSIKQENEEMKAKLRELHADEYFQIKQRLDRMNLEISNNNGVLSRQKEDISSLSAQLKNFIKVLNMLLILSLTQIFHTIVAS